MRRADIERAWQKLRERTDHGFLVDKVTLEGLSGFVDGTIEIGRPIFAICGQNGSGKTVLLQGLKTALDWASTKQSIRTRLIGSRVLISARLDNKASEIDLNLADPENISGDDIEKSAIFIDTSQEVPRVQAFFAALQDREEFLAAYPKRTLKAEHLAALSYVVQKSYSEITAYEIDDVELEGVQSPLPFFEFVEGGVRYDSRTASLGELSALHVFWRMSTAPAGSLLLLEEPESFMSEQSQSELLDLVADQAASRRQSVIFSTHSPRMVSSLAPEEVGFLVRTNAGVRFAEKASHPAIRVAMGFSDHIVRLAIVEDPFANKFLRFLAERIDPLFLSKVEVLGKGGKEALEKARLNFPKTATKLRLAFVYDGDMRGTIAAADDVHFLPTIYSPEKLLRTHTSQHSASIAGRLHVAVDEFDIRNNTLAGRNDHDWVNALAAQLGQTEDALTRIMVEDWLSVPENSSASRDLLRSLMAQLLK